MYLEIIRWPRDGSPLILSVVNALSVIILDAQSAECSCIVLGRTRKYSHVNARSAAMTIILISVYAIVHDVRIDERRRSMITEKRFSSCVFSHSLSLCASLYKNH